MATPNKYNTATVVGLVGATIVVLDPFIRAAGTYIQAHSSVVFPPEYMKTLTNYIEMAAMVLTVHLHSADSTPTPPRTE